MGNITKRKKLFKKLPLILGTTAIISTTALAYSNMNVKTTQYITSSPTTEMNITHLSDLHNFEYGENNSQLINKIKTTDPDIIVMTGDMIDAKKTDFNKIEEFINTLKNCCPCFYIEGNHEAAVSICNKEQYENYLKELKEIGVIVLNNESYEIPNSDVVIYGLTNYPNIKILKDINKDKYNIVLCHNPVYADEIAEYGPNLILSGHTHGGQVNIPGIGPVFSHGQGINAKYISGEWKINDTTLIVSNGLGSSQTRLISFRINVPPEIINIKIKKGDE